MKKSWIYIVIVIIVVLILIAVLNKSGTEGPVSSGEEVVELIEEELQEPISLTELVPLEGGFQSYNVLQINKSVEGNKLKVGGVEYEKGLGTHTVSEYKYAIKGGYNYFEASIGLDDESGCDNVAIFVVNGDEEELYRSNLIKPGEMAVNIKVPISGVNEIFLITEDGGDGISCDHTDWLNPVLVP